MLFLFLAPVLSLNQLITPHLDTLRNVGRFNNGKVADLFTGLHAPFVHTPQFLKLRYFPPQCPPLVCSRGGQPQPWSVSTQMLILVLILTRQRQMNEANAAEDFPWEESSFGTRCVMLWFGS